MIRFLRACLAVATAAATLMLNIEIGHSAGALAVGSCGAYGYSYDYRQATEAQSAAISKCSGNCTTVALHRECAALAIDVKESCGAHGYAVARRLGDAENTALRFCYRYGGKDCVIRAWLCDSKG
jgi:hypothetical protein